MSTFPTTGPQVILLEAVKQLTQEHLAPTYAAERARLHAVGLPADYYNKLQALHDHGVNLHTERGLAQQVFEAEVSEHNAAAEEVVTFIRDVQQAAASAPILAPAAAPWCLTLLRPIPVGSESRTQVMAAFRIMIAGLRHPKVAAALPALALPADAAEIGARLLNAAIDESTDVRVAAIDIELYSTQLRSVLQELTNLLTFLLACKDRAELRGPAMDGFSWTLLRQAMSSSAAELSAPIVPAVTTPAPTPNPTAEEPPGFA